MMIFWAFPVSDPGYRGRQGLDLIGGLLNARMHRFEETGFPHQHLSVLLRIPIGRALSLLRVGQNHGQVAHLLNR